MRAAALTMRHQLIGLGGVVERNVYLTRRYIWWDVAFMVWTIANTLTIVFIAEGFEATGGDIDVDRATTTLLIGAVVWAYLGIIFEFLTETVAWERWEGTIEYTFMAPLSRAMHLGGSGVFAVLYGMIRAALLFIVVALFFGLSMPDANFPAAIVLLLLASVSFFGIGMMTAVLPLISPEKGAQLGFVGQGMLLVVSGVYYPVTVLPTWMQWLSDDLARDLRTPGHPRLDPRRRRARVGGRVAAARHRRRLDPARALDLLDRRAVCEAAREAEAVGLVRDRSGGSDGRTEDARGEIETDVALVRRLLAGQFPQWADLPIEPVVSYGTDHDIYRLGDHLAARLPRIGWATGRRRRRRSGCRSSRRTCRSRFRCSWRWGIRPRATPSTGPCTSGCPARTPTARSTIWIRRPSISPRS